MIVLHELLSQFPRYSSVGLMHIYFTNGKVQELHGFGALCAFEDIQILSSTAGEGISSLLHNLETDIYKSYAQFSVVMMEPESQAGKSQIKGVKVALKGDPR